MKNPDVRRAFVQRLIDDAMQDAGWSEPIRTGGTSVYFPPRPATGVATITVTADDVADPVADLCGLAQYKIDTALASVEQEAA